MTDAWRPIAAFTYLTICLMDFVVFPIIYEITNYHERVAGNIVALALRFDPASQVAALSVLHGERVWVPITLAQSGLFHIAFGAILGVASWTHGQERIKRVTAQMQDSSLSYATRVQQMQDAAPPPAPVPPPPPPVPS